MLKYTMSLFLASICFGQTAQFQFYSSARNRTYTVYTQAIGDGFSFPGHGLYELAPLVPSPGTGGVYAVLFTSNLNAYQDGSHGEAIFFTWSNSAVGFATPAAILTNTGVGNICDMAGAKPIFDGSTWHVYVQAAIGTYTNPSSCSTNGYVFEATGPGLNNLQWVMQPGTNNALPVLGDSTTYIGQDQQWYYTAANGGPSSYPFMTTFNNWWYSGSGGGNQMFDYISPDGTNTTYYWFNNALASLNPGGVYQAAGQFPDALLKDTLDQATLGTPGIGFNELCVPGNSQYRYGLGLGFYPNLVPTVGSIWDGVPVAGQLASVSSDAYGPRMFSPKIFRDSNGYIPKYGSSSWETWIIYNPAKTNVNGSDSCTGYSTGTAPIRRFLSRSSTLPSNSSVAGNSVGYVSNGAPRTVGQPGRAWSPTSLGFATVGPGCVHIAFERITNCGRGENPGHPQNGIPVPRRGLHQIVDRREEGQPDRKNGK
jgi:hypothetical protein